MFAAAMRYVVALCLVVAAVVSCSESDEPCPLGFYEQYDCPGHCAQPQLRDVPPFWCSPACGDDAPCATGYTCVSDSYCLPTCSMDEDCSPAGTFFTRCDTAAGYCAVD